MITVQTCPGPAGLDEDDPMEDGEDDEDEYEDEAGEHQQQQAGVYILFCNHIPLLSVILFSI